MSRVQLALNVADVDQAVDFYSKLFGAEPVKRRPGYANFAIPDPPLKLVLIENPAERGLNHLGVEVGTPDDVRAAATRFVEAGMITDVQQSTTCCYAVQDKVWVTNPDGTAWEFYTVLADAPAETGVAGDGLCCAATETSDGRAGATVAPACCP